MPSQAWKTRTVGATVYPHHYLFMRWADSINNSGLYRRAIEAEMEAQDIEVETALEKTQSAIESGIDLETLAQQFDDFSELTEHEDIQNEEAD